MTARSHTNFPAAAATTAQPSALAPSAVHGQAGPMTPYPGAFKPLSREDVAEVLGISIRTLENWVKQGRLPAPASIAGRRYWHPERFYAALEAMLQQGSEQGRQSSLASPAVHAPAALAKPLTVPSSTAGQRARQSSQDASLAMLRGAAERAKVLPSVPDLT